MPEKSGARESLTRERLSAKRSHRGENPRRESRRTAVERVANTRGFQALSGCSKEYSKVPGARDGGAQLHARETWSPGVILDYYPLSPITYRALACCNFLVSHDTDLKSEQLFPGLFYFSHASPSPFLSLSLSLAFFFLPFTIACRFRALLTDADQFHRGASWRV